MTTKFCPTCGKPVAPDAPQGLCPECLMKAGLPTGSAALPPGGVRRAFVPPTVAALAPHFPQLEVIELIGQGGMGAVYKARQPRLDRLVALKILAPQLGAEPGFAERFMREARTLARLGHPHIVAVHDFGEAGGYHYLVMEYVDGVTLRHLLTERKLGAREALTIVPVLCGALQYAHDRGIIHRDIKPENILIDRAGTVKIADFGLAKLVGDTPEESALTSAGVVMGTPHYMAPEQVERPREVDHRADIYSLGVVFYQMLTGELPLGRFAPPSQKVDVDVHLDEIVLRALEKEPQRRYQQASVLQGDVEAVAAAGPRRRVEPPGAVESIRRGLTELLGVGEPPPRREPPGSPANARAEGSNVVVPRRGARLPLRCVETGDAVSKDQLRTVHFEWCPPVVALSLLLTPLAFLIFYFLFRIKVQVEVPLSEEGRRLVRRRIWFAVAWMLGGVSLGLLAVGVRLLNWPPPLATAVLFLGLGVVTIGVIYGLLRGRTLRLTKIAGGEAWFGGASPAFLAALPPYRREG